jgi:hypothetical protein
MLGLLALPRQRRLPFQASSRMRVEVCPPSLRHKPSSAWQRLMFWLLAPAPMDAAPPLDRLPAVRDDFADCIDDIDGDAADALAERIDRARSLREFWHLRAEAFMVVASRFGEAEARTRVARLNRHFPTRSPRSGFAPFMH